MQETTAQEKQECAKHDPVLLGQGENWGEKSSDGGGRGGRALGNSAAESQPPLSCVSGLVITSPHGFQTREATCSSIPASDLSWSSGISA